MNIKHFSNLVNNYKPKIRLNHKNSSQNTKLNQYPEKTRKLHKTPINTLNKSQNIIITKNVFKTNINNLTNNNSIFINPKKIFPIQNIKNLHFFNKNKNLKLSPFLCNNKEKNRSFLNNNKSLSNYFTKTCSKIKYDLRRNYTNNNILKINNENISNFNLYNKNNIFYHKNNDNNLNNNNSQKKSPITKIKEFLDEENKILSKNKDYANDPSYPLMNTDESKKILENRQRPKIKKPESLCNTYVKVKYPSIKKIKTCSAAMLIKPNFILKNNQNKSNINSIIKNKQKSPSEGLQKKSSTKKNNDYTHLVSFENKIFNELKELKGCKRSDIIEKIKIITNEAIESLVPKESQNVFLLIMKQIFLIIKEYSEIIFRLKRIIVNLKNKINNYESKSKELINEIKMKEKDINLMKIEMDKLSQEKKSQNLELKTISEDNDSMIKKNLKKNISSIDLKIKRDYNVFLNKLNAQNVDDLDALYFFDKVKCKHFSCDKNLPKLNLDEKFIEKCMQKELIKRNEKNLSPFQKVALQFEFLNP
jgi:hypothetical protein